MGEHWAVAAFTLGLAFGGAGLLAIGLTCVGVYRLVAKLVTGILEGLRLITENSTSEHAEIRDSIHRVGDAVINVHREAAGGPPLDPGPFGTTLGPAISGPGKK